MVNWVECCKEVREGQGRKVLCVTMAFCWSQWSGGLVIQPSQLKGLEKNGWTA